jgi:hypothetical protein
LKADAARRLAQTLPELLHENTKLTADDLRRVPAADDAWSAPAAPPAAVVPLPALPSPPALGVSTQAAILHRRSVRRYAQRAMPAATLGRLLWLGSAVEPGMPGLLHVYAFLWSVEGVPPGAYRYVRERHALARVGAGPSREETLRSVFQKEFTTGTGLLLLVGDIAAAVGARGPRGYRHLLMQAGMMGETLYLAGAALGIGLSGNGGLRETTAQRHCGLDGVRRDLLWSLAFGPLEPVAPGGEPS